MSATQLKSVGDSSWRKDGISKVTGSEQYAPDISVDRMWYGRVLRSPHAHARIVSVDTSAAEAMGAVCLTFADVPQTRYNERIVSTPPCLYRDRTVVADKARHVGEALVGVAAPTEELAEKALRSIKIEYEVLQVITTIEQAQKDGADPVHDTVLLNGEDKPIINNVAVQRTIDVGDTVKGFAESDFVIERSFKTGRIYHAQMEPKTVICQPEADGGITVWASTQSIHNTRILLGQIYGLPLNKVNVKKVALGGAFGSSIQMNSVTPIGVGLALKSGHPVKIATTREEDMHDHVRYPSEIKLKLGMKKDGTLIAGEMHAFEFKLKQYVGLGGTFWGQGPASKCIIRSDGVPELLKTGAELINWDKRPKPGSQTGRMRRGIGMARGFHTSGVGHAKASGAEMIDYSGAIVKLNEDGTVDLIQSLMDHGGGTNHAISKIVAEELGVPNHMVGISPCDTRTSLYDVTTHATRGIYAGGAAALKAAKAVKEQIIDWAARVLDVLPESLVIEPDQELGQGVIYCPNLAERRMTVGDLARYLHLNSLGTISSSQSMRQVNCPPAYVSYYVDVEVDTDTGQIHSRRAALGSDCGTVVNPALASGQLIGGLSKGQGYALTEDNQWDPVTGELASKGFWVDGKTPSISESPLVADIETHFAHTYEPTGPFGAKGLGEAAKNPAAAAFANAVYSALGIRFYELPITPEKVLAALAEQAAGKTARAARQAPAPVPVAE
ncbi:MAG: molybdopterin-dependent oxidoreductase [Rhodobacter sp.]|nr:molybdopterin-dependent oxidoreductase [Rhodobacter sp.]